jgi:hypothetical protein
MTRSKRLQAIARRNVVAANDRTDAIATRREDGARYREYAICVKDDVEMGNA